MISGIYGHVTCSHVGEAATARRNIHVRGSEASAETRAGRVWISQWTAIGVCWGHDARAGRGLECGVPGVTLTLSMLRCPDAVPPQTRTVLGGEFSIGRGSENDWVLQDPERF